MRSSRLKMLSFRFDAQILIVYFSTTKLLQQESFVAWKNVPTSKQERGSKTVA